MSKKINKYMPFFCLIALIVIFLRVMMNLFYIQMTQQGMVSAVDGSIDENRKIDLQLKYPVKEDKKDEYRPKLNDKIIKIAKNVKDRVEPYTSTLIPEYDTVFALYRKYNNSIGWNYNIIPSFGDKGLLKYDNGYLNYAVEKLDEDEADKIAGKIQKVRDFLAEEGINFYYINGGFKSVEERGNLPSYNEKADNGYFNEKTVIEAMKKRGINLLDIREEAKKDKKDWFSLFYKYDHHMKTDSQLWVAGKIAKLLEEKEGYKFNKNLFSISEYNLEKNKVMFGSQARGILKNGIMVSPEEYTKIIPKADTFFEIELPLKGLIRKGNYEDSLFSNSVYKRVVESGSSQNYYYANNPDAYSCTTWGIDPLGIIRNKIPNPNKGKKVLIFQDSFGNYTSTYLAQGLDEIHLIYNPAFNGSVKAYIKEVKPDVVLMFNTSNQFNKMQAKDVVYEFNCYDIK